MKLKRCEIANCFFAITPLRHVVTSDLSIMITYFCYVLTLLL